MAVGKVTVFDRALTKIGAGVIDLDTNAFKVALLGDGQAMSAAFAGTSTDARFSDLTDEVSGTCLMGQMMRTSASVAWGNALKRKGRCIRREGACQGRAPLRGGLGRGVTCRRTVSPAGGRSCVRGAW